MTDRAKRPVIIDTDPGVDDASAILWVLTSGRFDVKALTVTGGNVGIDTCLANALRLLEVTGQTGIPVYKGAYWPILKPGIHAVGSHGRDGFGNINFPEPGIRAQGGSRQNRTNPSPYWPWGRLPTSRWPFCWIPL